MIEKIEVLITPFKKKRTIHIYLPDDYEESSERYPVMYMYDGHNLFSDADATYGKCWGLADFMERYDKKFIIVGMECCHEGHERLNEYCPYDIEKGYFGPITGKGKQTMDWVVEELKPYIDKHYRTIPFRECTGIGGSSMGGLMAFYTIIKYNLWFSKAACLSPSYIYCQKELLADIGKLDPNTRIYISVGAQEVSDVSLWKQDMQKFLDKLAVSKVYCNIYVDPTGMHNEATWEKQNRRYFDELWKDGYKERSLSMKRVNFGAKPFIYPMPVLIIATYDEKGVPNAMNAAWGIITDTNEITISMSEHKTTENLAVTGAFTVSIGTEDTVTACDYVGVESASKVPDKFKRAGFHARKSTLVNAPLIDELPMTLECRVKSYEDEILIGEIVNVSADESILTNGKIDPKKLKPIAYDPVNHTYMALGEVVGRAFGDGLLLK